MRASPSLLLLVAVGCLRNPDRDGDGFRTADDCDDLDASSFPGGVEQCDYADNDCNGEVDEGFVR